jgi:quercetin dioxygenase-like cupin family protein
MSEPSHERPAASLIDLLERLQFREQGPQAQVLEDRPEVRLVGFALRAEQEITEHRSPSRLFVQVIDGSLVFTVADQSFALRAGLVLQVDAGVPHSLRATSDALMLLVMTPSPARIHA